MGWRVIHGECGPAMAAMPEASVDAIVCDPPYGLEFMGKGWDGADGFRRSLNVADVGRDDPFGRASRTSPEYRAGHLFQEWCESWAIEALRVLKPGGHLLAFGGTRTSHRLVCAIEDAGFEIRDTIAWMYGSGFPKSLDVSKAIDKAAGAEREEGRPYLRPGDGKPYALDAPTQASGDGTSFATGQRCPIVTAPATPDAERWQGWGTALKPAHEPIVVARKPLTGTVAATVLEHGTGALNIDGCRVGLEGGGTHCANRDEAGRCRGHQNAGQSTSGETFHGPDTSGGRWPANVVLSHSPGCREVGTRKVRGDNRSTGNGTRPAGFANIGAATGDGEPNAAVYGDSEVPAWECVEGCAVRLLDEQTGDVGGGFGRRGAVENVGDEQGLFGIRATGEQVGFGDSGGASRFFYAAKADSAERHAGLGKAGASLFSTGDEPEANLHPTVKPIDLMRWLVRLVTPPGGTVLDPFAGSGTTGCAAVLEGFDFVGIEREAEYVAICRARLAHWSSGATEEVNHA
jgi:DNA modification methylase